MEIQSESEDQLMNAVLAGPKKPRKFVRLDWYLKEPTMDNPTRSAGLGIVVKSPVLVPDQLNMRIIVSPNTSVQDSIFFLQKTLEYFEGLL